MNRDRYIPRIVRADDDQLVQIPDGGEDAEILASALAATSTREFLLAVLRHKQAIDEFGGEFYVAAARKKIDRGEIVEESELGSYETVGYIVSYSKLAQIKGQSPEPDVRHLAVGPTAKAPTVSPPAAEPDLARGTEEPPVPAGVNSGSED